MKYTDRFGMHISKIGLGTGRFGTRVPESLSYEMLDVFTEHGGNVIDTARNYYEWVENGRGMSEKTIGKWMMKRGNRENVILSTKGGVRNEGKHFIMNLSRDSLIQELQESLDALQTEYLDFYLLHRDEPERSLEEIMDTLQQVRELGKVGAIGVCNWEPDRIMAANEYALSHGLEPIQIVQTWWSIAAYTPDMWNDPTTSYMNQKIYEYMKAQNMMGMAYTSQAKGFFQKAIKEGYENLDEFLKSRIATEENLRRLHVIEEYCREHNVSPTAVVNGYITDNKLDGIALVSCSKMEQLLDILEHCDVTIDGDMIGQFPLTV